MCTSQDYPKLPRGAQGFSPCGVEEGAAGAGQKAAGLKETLNLRKLGDSQRVWGLLARGLCPGLLSGSRPPWAMSSADWADQEHQGCSAAAETDAGLLPNRIAGKGK